MEPKIRLKGFSGEWETHTLSEYFKKVCDKNTKMEYTTVLTNSAEHGVIPQSDFFDHAIANNKNIGGYYIVSPDDFVYNPRVSVTAPVGPINRSLLNYSGVMSPLYLVFKINGINKDYLNIFYKTNKWHNFMKLEGNCGARFDRLSIGDDQFVKMPLTHPKDNDEQQGIADYFQHLDTLIQSTTKKIESLKQVKAASLQSMFPQEGETTPRVRFKGFEGEWKEVSLGEETYPAGIKNHDNLPLESFSISNEYGFIPQNVQFENGGTMATADKRMYYIVSKNSFGYNPARINVGSLGYYTGEDDVIVSSLYEIFKTSDRICDTFLLYWFKTSTFQKLIEQYQEGGVRFYFFYDKLCMCHTLVPSYEEQQKIADYFTNLDSQITLQTQRLEKLKQIKSACLDNMFV